MPTVPIPESDNLPKDSDSFLDQTLENATENRASLDTQKTEGEIVMTPEAALQVKESETSQPQNQTPETMESLQQTLRKTKRPLSAPTVKKDDLTMQVEHIMEEGMADAFRAMTPVQQQEFKLKGERTALDIRALLEKTKVKVKKIFRLLLDWLKIIPGVNKFFLVQEAKIKADKIMALKRMKDIDE